MSLEARAMHACRHSFNQEILTGLTYVRCPFWMLRIEQQNERQTNILAPVVVQGTRSRLDS